MVQLLSFGVRVCWLLILCAAAGTARAQTVGGAECPTSFVGATADQLDKCINYIRKDLLQLRAALDTVTKANNGIMCAGVISSTGSVEQQSGCDFTIERVAGTTGQYRAQYLIPLSKTGLVLAGARGENARSVSIASNSKVAFTLSFKNHDGNLVDTGFWFSVLAARE